MKNRINGYTKIESSLAVLLCGLLVGLVPCLNWIRVNLEQDHAGAATTVAESSQEIGKSDLAMKPGTPPAENHRPGVDAIKTADQFMDILDNDRHTYDSVELSDAEARIVVNRLRQRYPVVPLANRLEPFNSTERINNLRKLYSMEPMETALMMNPRDRQLSERQSDAFEVRLQALISLHGSKANEFIQANGFGVYRMPSLNAESLRYRESGPLALNSETGTNAVHLDDTLIDLVSEASSSSGNENEFASSEDFDSANNTPIEPSGIHFPGTDPADYQSETMPVMPTREVVESFNRKATSIFLNAARIGLHRRAESLREYPHSLETELPPRSAIGFVGHGIDYLYDQELGIRIWTTVPADSKAEPNSWKLNRLELVSLLKDDSFQVYVSENLPNMNELKDVPTRPLNSFEFLALGKLFQHQEVVIESTTNRIRMLGALRASESCLECHDVKNGELLGAFSYELIRRK